MGSNVVTQGTCGPSSGGVFIFDYQDSQVLERNICFDIVS